MNNILNARRAVPLRKKSSVVRLFREAKLAASSWMLFQNSFFPVRRHGWEPESPNRLCLALNYLNYLIVSILLVRTEFDGFLKNNPNKEMEFEFYNRNVGLPSVDLRKSIMVGV